MHKASATNIITQLRSRWVYKALLSQLLVVLAVTVFLSALLHKLLLLPPYFAVPCFICLVLISTAFKRSWKLSDRDVARFLNITQPSLEESAGLVLKAQEYLNPLERLQRIKVEKELVSYSVPDPFKKQLNTSLVLLLIALASSFIIAKISFPLSFPGKPGAAKTIPVTRPIPERMLPQVKSADIIITPPSYTRKSSKQQHSFNLLAEEGGIVFWQIQTNVPAKTLAIIFNNGTTLSFKGNAAHSDWKAQKLIQAQGFYQVKIDDNFSELYKIEMIKDQRPAIAIQSPKPNTSIKYGEPERLMVKAMLTDDYGIIAASITATISSGEGEGVKFKEQALSFTNFAAGRQQCQLQKSIDCKALGMQPGDELYFYVSAIDNHNQETRSDVFIVALQDTTDLSGMDGLVSPLDIKPELFRSQRQIIIETEQLIKNKATITTEDFRKKSNDLGFDQRLLRLRYGKFLGEETNAEIGSDHHDEENHRNEDNHNSTNEILEQYGHSHDNAEDATFFDAATKNQLKATLSEMWNAELKLRLLTPKEALPYEYKALRLLKDLQQKSRAYVQKTGFKPTPLNADKRLTGDLTKINQPVTEQNFKNPEASAIILRHAFGALEQLKVNSELSASSQDMLQQALRQLSISAGGQPSVYLAPLSALRNILANNFTMKDIDNAAQGLQRMVAGAENLPYPEKIASTNLSGQYFIKLNKGSR